MCKVLDPVYEEPTLGRGRKTCLQVSSVESRRWPRRWRKSTQYPPEPGEGCMNSEWTYPGRLQGAPTNSWGQLGGRGYRKEKDTWFLLLSIRGLMAETDIFCGKGDIEARLWKTCYFNKQRWRIRHYCLLFSSPSQFYFVHTISVKIIFWSYNIHWWMLVEFWPNKPTSSFLQILELKLKKKGSQFLFRY